MDLRLDRLATLYLVHPLLRCAPAQQPSVPILMYHAIVEDGEAGVHPYYRTTTPPSLFAEQMRYLKDQGYRSLSLEQALGGVEEGKGGGGGMTRAAVITFDDGYSDFYTNAFPVLERHGFTASVFLPTAYIGQSRRKLKGRDCLTWSEVRELERQGISFGSHTVSHPQLRELEFAAVEREIVDSKAAIEDQLGRAVESFAYPYAFPEADGEFKRRLRGLLQRAGYGNGVCTTVGRLDADSDRYFLRRLPVNSADDSKFFAAKLAGAYDWVARPQYLVKWAKGSSSGKAAPAARTEGAAGA